MLGQLHMVVGHSVRPDLSDAIAVGTLFMPGPFAVQVAIFIGYLRFGFWSA